MQAAARRRAVAAASSAATSLGLLVDDAVVLSDSNRLVVRLTPCDVVARVAVAPAAYRARLEREVEVAGRLTEAASPVAGLDARVEPRVLDHGGFAITMWAYVEPSERPVPSDEYLDALGRLHAGLRQVDVPSPHVLDRVADTRHDVTNREVTPDLADADRSLLTDALDELGRSSASRRPSEQLLHGEPHPWNVLSTGDGLCFIDFENCARGPIECDLAWVPAAVSESYPAADQDLVDQCRGAVLAIIVAHRWSTGDEHPSGRRSGVAFLDALRQGSPYPAIEEVQW